MEPATKLSQNEILKEMDEAALKLQSNLNLDFSTCHILLQKSKWHIKPLVDAYNCNSKEFLIEHGAAPKHIETEEPLECVVCCSTDQILHGLTCNHRACDACWKSYIKEQLKNGKIPIECLESHCNLTICERNLRKLGGPSLSTSYWKLMVKNYVIEHSRLTFCPGCDRIVKKGRLDSVACCCGTRFCFVCNEHAHFPATCEQVNNWKKECPDHQDGPKTPNNASIVWIQRHTKRCPACFTPIQKNGGCDHMKCGNKQCGHMFCWNCLEGLHLYTNRCVTSFGRRAVRNINEVSDLFYFSRLFEEQNEKFKREKSRSKHVHNTLYRSHNTTDDRTWKRNAYGLLLQCRQTLLYSNILDYHKRSRRGWFFRNYRESLANATDELSNALNDHFYRDFRRFQQMIDEKIVFAEKCLSDVTDHCVGDKKMRRFIWKIIMITLLFILFAHVLNLFNSQATMNVSPGAIRRKTVTRAEKEQERLGTQKVLIYQMKDLLISKGYATETELSSKEIILFKVVQLISSVNLHDSFPPAKFTEFTGQEKRNKIEQNRRDKTEAAHRALRKFILDEKLVDLSSGIKLERITVLETILKFLNTSLGGSDPLPLLPSSFVPLSGTGNVSPVLTQNTVPSTLPFLFPFYQNILQSSAMLYDSIFKGTPSQVNSDTAENQENVDYDEEIDVMG